MTNEAWREFWSGADQAGHVVGGAYRDRLAAHWRDFFRASISATKQGAVIADIASGAGAALAVAVEIVAGTKPGGVTLGAFDISGAAVKASLRVAPGAIGTVADASLLPFPDASIDIAVSQFGLEYAGVEAFAEAARVIAPGGRFCSISHYAGGAIDLECANNENLLAAVARTGLVEAARATFKVSYARQSRRDPKPIDALLEGRFASAFAAAGSAVRAAPVSAARGTLDRFVNDLARLGARRFAYEPAEALAWIDGMDASLDAYRRRMQSMRAAALNPQEITTIAAQFAAAGLAGFSAAPLVLDAARPPAGWVIEAHRPA